MSSHPSNPSPTSPDSDSGKRSQLDETSGIDSLPRTDETTAFDNKKTQPTGNRPKEKPARSVGGYALGDMLGQGGMGRVFKADDSTGRSVALKLLSPDLARSPEALARFKQEGLIASQINHPHCVFVHRVDDDSGTPFIAMELMTGQTLKDLVLRHGPLHYKEAIRLIMQCVDGLIEAHSLGMIHRDIKPANCYLDDDSNVKIGDFGLARSLISDSELTQTGAFLGTPLFASPEQLLGQVIDARSDIYSLTATLYYLLAGKAPFESPHAAQVIARIASSDPPKFKSAGVDVPSELEQIVMKGLSRDASRRYATFSQMREDLQKIIEPTSQPTTLARRAFAWVLDYFVMATVIATVLFSLGSAAKSESNQLLPNLIGKIVVFVYYVISESIFAATLGKAVLRVTVVDAKTGGRPKFTSVLARAILAITCSSALLFVVKLAVPNLSPVSEFLLVASSFLVNIVILCSTWWQTGKRQLLHDWLSGTECRTRLGWRSAIRSSIDLPAWSVPTIAVSGSARSIPKRLGRFEISDEICCNNPVAGIRWLVGQDLQLERSVWLACLTDMSIEFEKAQYQKPKSLRLRFIEEGLETEFRWFAYVAPDGIPLSECARNGVQFPWSITRTILGEAVAVSNSPQKSSGALTNDEQLARQCVLEANRTWVDPLGRLCLVDFECTEFEKTEFVPLVAKLGLPPRHQLRKSDVAVGTKTPLSVESLPPLSAVRLLESIASTECTAAKLKLDLEKVDKQSRELTPSVRFVSAAASLGLMSLLLFLAVVMFVVPSVILISDGIYREIRKLRSLAAYAENPESFSAQWELLPEEERLRWTDHTKRNEIEAAIEVQTGRMQVALASVGSVENMILRSIPAISLDNPPIYGSKPENSNKEEGVTLDEPTPKIKVSSGPINIVEVNFGNEKVDAELMKSIVTSVERSKVAPSSNKNVPAFAIVAFGILISTVWTTLTFGGVTRRFAGYCLMRRDGQRLGFTRSFIRACVFYAPFLALAYLISYCNIGGFEYLWWGTQLKRAFFILPVAYLVTTLIWNQRTPLDLLTGTVAVSR